MKEATVMIAAFLFIMLIAALGFQSSSSKKKLERQFKLDSMELEIKRQAIINNQDSLEIMQEKN